MINVYEKVRMLIRVTHEAHSKNDKVARDSFIILNIMFYLQWPAAVAHSGVVLR